MESPVNRIIGIVSVRGSARSRRMSSTPDRSGRLLSAMMPSKSSVATTDSPSSAVVTCTTSAVPSRAAWMKPPMALSSSMTSSRGRRPLSTSTATGVRPAISVRHQGQVVQCASSCLSQLPQRSRPSSVPSNGQQSIPSASARWQEGQRGTLTESMCVARSTSSYVVSPACAAASAEARSVIIPWARAAAPMAASVGVVSRTLRTSAVTGSTSKTPVRPR